MTTSVYKDMIYRKLIEDKHVVKLRGTQMCVGATKGTYRRDIKMIVNHDYIKQCIIFAKKFLG